MALTAWRLWVVQNDRLRSLFVGREEWPEHEPYKARCIRPTFTYWGNAKVSMTAHEAPGVDCQCGIYACLDLPYMLEKMHSSCDGAGAVVGACRVWGQVIPHERGYVAQFCRPTALFAGELGGKPRTWAPESVVRTVARRYGLTLLDPEEAGVWANASA